MAKATATTTATPTPGYGPPSELCAIPVLGYTNGDPCQPIFAVCVICGQDINAHLTAAEQVAKGFACPPAGAAEK